MSQEIPEVNGKVILFYTTDEAPSIEHAREILDKHGIVPIACKNPANFRFVMPEVIPVATLDLVSRAALTCMDKAQPYAEFFRILRMGILGGQK